MNGGALAFKAAALPENSGKQLNKQRMPLREVKDLRRVVASLVAADRLELLYKKTDEGVIRNLG